MSEETPKVENEAVAPKKVVKKAAPKKVVPVVDDEPEAEEKSVDAKEEGFTDGIPDRVKPTHEIIRVGGKDYAMPNFQIVRYPNGVVRAYGPDGNHSLPPATTKEAVIHSTKFVASSNVMQHRKHNHDITGLAPTTNPLLR